MSDDEVQRLGANDGQLGDLVSQVREDLPPEERMATVAAGLGALLDVPPAGAPAPAVAAGGSSWVLWLGAAVIGVAAGGAWLASSASGTPEPGLAVPDSDLGSATKAGLTPAEPAPEPAAAPEAEVAAETPGTAATDAALAPGTQAPSRKSALASEARLLERARQSLKRNPRGSLSLTQEHKRRFPSGVLSQEREVIAITALKRLKRDEAAQRRAGEFGREHEGSAHQKKIDSLVDGGAKAH